MRFSLLVTVSLLLASCTLSIHSTPNGTPSPRPAPSVSSAASGQFEAFELRRVKLAASRSLQRTRLITARRAAARAAARRRARAAAVWSSASVWAASSFARAVANCESRGNVHDRANPRYRGKWQMGFAEWADEGGAGDPADATEAEQDFRAWKLWRSRGWQPWTCAGLVS